MIVSLADVKTYLDITDCESDTRLQAILDECEGFLLSYLGNIAKGTKTERVEKSMCKHNVLPFKIGNVTKINTINGTDFTAKVEGVDYVLNSDGTAEVLNLLDYVLVGDFSTFTISYEAGYDPIPEEIVGAVSEYVGAVFATENGRDVIKEQL